MFVKPIKTRIFLPPKDDLFSLLGDAFSKFTLKEKTIIVIASKIVSIGQGRCVKMDSIEKDELIKKEADFYLDRDKVPKGHIILTMKDNILISSAGIDESNGNKYFILWPEKPFNVAEQIYDFVKENYRLKDLGIIIADSHCIPTRRGTMGISMAHYGFNPLKDYRETKDIFGRGMKMSQSNIVDSLSAAAVLIMGEGNEQTPIAIIENIDFVKFGKFNLKENDSLNINTDDDIYAPLLKAIKWQKKNKL